MKLEDGLAGRISVPKRRRDVTIFDTETPGLFLRKFSTGRAMYGVSYSINGKPRRVIIRDAVERGSLAKARSEALDVRAKARLGNDILAEREAAKAAAAAEARRQVTTLEAVAKRYLEARRSELRPRSYIEVKRHINKCFKPLHEKPIETITRADIVAVMDDLERERGKVATDRALTSLGTLFAYAIDRGYVVGSPILHIRRRAGNIDRDRTLSPGELAEVWRAAGERRDDYGRIVRLLILMGSRKSEVGSFAWSEIVENGAGWRIELPPERVKNHRWHLVPLCPLALAHLPQKPASDDPEARTTCFGRRHHTGFSGWSKAKSELDASIATNRRKAGVKRDMQEWRLHDLRRTFSTQMRELRIADTHLVELLLNHVGGSRGGVAGVYDRSERMEERREALNRWAAWVERESSNHTT